MQLPVAAIERVTQNVAGAFASLADSRLAAWSGPSAHTPPYEAYVQYIQGLEAMARRQTSTALEYFDRAVAADSNFVEAMLWLSEALESAPNWPAARRFVVKMLDARRDRLAPYDQAVLDTKIGWYSGDRELMYRAAVRMTLLAPGSNDAHWAHGSTAVMTNRFGEAIEAFARVDESRGWMKDWDYYLRWPSLAHHAQGHYERELSLIRAHCQRFPRSMDLCLLELRALAALGRLTEIDRISPICNALPTATNFQAALTHHYVAKELRTHGLRDAARAHADSAVAAFRSAASENRATSGCVREWRSRTSKADGGRRREPSTRHSTRRPRHPSWDPDLDRYRGRATGRHGSRRLAATAGGGGHVHAPELDRALQGADHGHMGREEEALRGTARGPCVGVRANRNHALVLDIGLERLHPTRGWEGDHG